MNNPLEILNPIEDSRPKNQDQTKVNTPYFKKTSKIDEQLIFFFDFYKNLFGYSINTKKVVYYFKGMFENGEKSTLKIKASFDRKSLFVYDSSVGFYQFNIRSFKKINNIEIKGCQQIEITCDNKFLVVGEKHDSICKLWSIQNRKLVHVWKLPSIVTNFECTYDSKYLVIGTEEGYLSVFDLKKLVTLKTIEFSQSISITSITLAKNNQ